MPARDRASHPRTTHELEAMRFRLALLATQAKLLRVRHLMRKYDPNQPRVPAGQGNGGQWSPAGGGGGSPGQTQQRTLLDGGGEVLSIRVRSGRGDWNEQHRVITPDGESRLFETEGDVQTIRDGQTGEVLSRGTFAGSGTPSAATIQPVFLPLVAAPVIAPAVATTLEAAALLFTYLVARQERFGKAPGTTALRYDFEPDAKTGLPRILVSRVDQATLNQECPLNREVQATTDEAAKRLKALYPHLDNTRLGSMIHLDAGRTILARNYPNVKVEFSLNDDGKELSYGRLDTIRLDIYELTRKNMVCIYDIKTGNTYLEPKRALRLVMAAKLNYPESRGVIMNQIKPQP